MPPRAPANANGHQSAGLTLRCLEQFRQHTADQVATVATGRLVGDVSRSARVRQLSSQKEKVPPRTSSALRHISARVSL